MDDVCIVCLARVHSADEGEHLKWHAANDLHSTYCAHMYLFSDPDVATCACEVGPARRMMGLPERGTTK